MPKYRITPKSRSGVVKITYSMQRALDYAEDMAMEYCEDIFIFYVKDKDADTGETTFPAVYDIKTHEVKGVWWREEE